MPVAAVTRSGSQLAVPIWFGDRVLGVIDVYRSEASGFDESDLFILESLSNQVAAGIQNAQLYDTVNAQLAEVSTLYMLADQISSSLETSVVLDSVTDILKRVLNCRGCVIFLLDENREWLNVQVSSGIKPYWQQHARFRMGEGIAGRVAQTGQPIYIADGQRMSDFIVFDPAVQSVLVVPLIYKGQVIGTLNVDDDKPNAFAGDVERLLSIAATQAAAAIQNARLFEALKERAERLDRAHRELQESDRLRSEFVQNMSHELRTPLTFIKGYVELLLAGTLGDLTAIQRGRLQIVAERTDLLIKLVNDILALQTIERGGVQLAVVSLEEVAHSEVRSARAMAQQEGLYLIEDYEPDLRPVLGDPERLGRVFVNLIGNAIKFSSTGGTFTVRLRNADDSVQAQVIDQGIGIAEDQLDRIFERFYQVDGSTKRTFGGTGLGLAIVKEIVDAHGGRITVASELGVGSIFTFVIPAATEQMLLTAGLLARET
jgi:signal transduction histidine kinase